MVKERKPSEVIGKEAQERPIEGNHKGTKTQSFSWCLCVFVVQIPKLARSKDVMRSVHEIAKRKDSLSCFTAVGRKIRLVGNKKASSLCAEDHRLEAYATYFCNDP